MSADNRSVHTDALATLGTIIGDGEARDAIHLAVEPVIAGERLRPGEHVLLKNGKAFGAELDLGLGIVDPFLGVSVEAGARFWLVVYPRRITSLRHVWEHPDFDAVSDVQQGGKVIDPKTDSMAWIENYASSLSGVDYDDEYRTITAGNLIEYAKTWIEPSSQWGGDYLVRGGLLEGVSTNPNFWDHFEVVTGLKAPHERPNFFSCSC